MKEIELFFIYEYDEEQRLDKYLADKLPEYSRSRLQSLIREGAVLVNGEPASKTGLKLEKNQQVLIHIPPTETTELKPESIPLNIVFENLDLLLINKPAGMVVHPSAGHASGTLVHAALAHAPEMEGIGGELRPGVVHRLDKNTSGLIIMAKNDRSHRWLQDQFRLRKVKKIYQALVDGTPPTPKGRIEAPIDRDPSHRKKMAVVPAGKGREAITEYFTKENFLHHTFLEAHILTGRTHQIRLHMAFLNCPIVGDTIYGRKHPTIPIDRHFLHAAFLEITLPGESQSQQFTAPLPTELEDILKQLQSSKI